MSGVPEMPEAAGISEMSKVSDKKLALPRYALVDLSCGTVEPLPISEQYYRLFLGGKTLAARLLLDLTEPGIDALAPEAVCIINTGPLNGTGAPSSSRFNLSFKNVLTGGIASTNCGGPFGYSLRRSGYDGIVIRGAAAEPVLLEINEDVISLRDGAEYWGSEVGHTQQLIEENLGKGYAAFIIGPAGENLVSFAGVASGERIAGRCGGGAVFGSKNLKGLICKGRSREIPVYHKEGFKKYVAKWSSFLKAHPTTGSALPRYGSAGIINKANATESLPTRNFSRGFFAEADKVSGETLAETVLATNKGCVSCPIRCERRVRLENDPNKVIKGPEYETLGLFGPNIENSDLEAIIKINYLCDELGMDTISLAGTLAWAMELHEHGGKDFGVRFGDTQSVIDLIPRIARCEGDAAELARGVKWLAAQYGGEEYAIHAKGLELASYEPRRSVGMGLGYATSNRGGCHLNGGYLALLESINVLSMGPNSPAAKPQWTAFIQNALDAVSSAGCCLFSALTFIPSGFYSLGPNHWFVRAVNRILLGTGPMMSLTISLSSALRFNTLFLFPHAEAARLATGLPVYTGTFALMGERCFNLERLYSLREGLSAADDSLPRRLTDELQDPNDPRSVVPLAKMLKKYYRVRGWDEQGVPTPKKLRNLGIEGGR
jgi:aldehyde:ferredoxin oxidoreductase